MGCIVFSVLCLITCTAGCVVAVAQLRVAGEPVVAGGTRHYWTSDETIPEDNSHQ